MEEQGRLGEYLRSEREKRHITIEQVASATKINVKLLHALESDNYDALPAKPFVRGFITSYTRYVGLNCEDVLERFDNYLSEKSGVKFKRPEHAPHIFVGKESTTDNSKTILSVVMASFVVAAIVVFVIIKPSLKHRHRSKDKVTISNEEIVTVVPPPSEGAPVLTETKPPEIKPTETKPAETKPVEEAKVDSKPEVPKKAEVTKKEEPKQAEPAAKPVSSGKLPPIPDNEVKHRLVVRAIEDSWVKYQVDDRPIQQYTLKKDKVIYIRARESIRFHPANPKGVEISSTGKGEFKPYGNGTKTMIIPKQLEAQYKEQPFVTPKTDNLSTQKQ